MASGLGGSSLSFVSGRSAPVVAGPPSNRAGAAPARYGSFSGLLTSAELPEGFTLLVSALGIPGLHQPRDPVAEDRELILSAVEDGKLVQ